MTSRDITFREKRAGRHELMIQVKDKDYFPVVVVANKCDLEYERQVQPHGKLVEIDAGGKSSS